MSQILNVLFGVDPENCFFPLDLKVPGTGELPVAGGDEILEPALVLFDYTRSLRRSRWSSGLSRDKHPRNTVHFAEFGGRWPVHGVDGTPGSAFHPRIQFMAALSRTFKKGFRNSDDGYAATEAVDEMTGESLDEVYSQNGSYDRSRVVFYIWGLATDYCVKETVLELRKLGYQVVLLTDAIRAVNINPGDGEAAIREMVEAGAITKTTKDIIGGWRFGA